MRVIFARPGGLVLSFSGHGLCAFLPWDRASKPVVHYVTTALLPAQIWICMASSWHAECAFASEHTFPVGSILAASRGNSQAWLDPGNPGPHPDNAAGVRAPGVAVRLRLPWRWPVGTAGPLDLRTAQARGSNCPAAHRATAWRRRAAHGPAWSMGSAPEPCSVRAGTGRARPVVSVCSWAPRFRRLLTRSSPRTWPGAESAGGSVGDAEDRPKQRPATFLHCGGSCPKSLS